MEDPDASIIGLKNNRRNDGTIRKRNEKDRERDKKDSKEGGGMRKGSKEEKMLIISKTNVQITDTYTHYINF